MQQTIQHHSAVPALGAVDDEIKVIALSSFIKASIALSEVPQSRVEGRHEALIDIEEDIEIGIFT